jgi:hypothetical protein
MLFFDKKLSPFRFFQKGDQCEASLFTGFSQPVGALHLRQL